MKHNVWRPLLAVAFVVALILLARVFIVPKDFGVGDKGYRFTWHRVGNEQEWKDFKVKYQGSDYCADCHSDEFTAIKASPHKDIACENCHGPAVRMVDGAAKKHPDDVAKLDIDTSRDLCLRCHFPLPYPSTGRAKIKFMDPAPDGDCVACHSPHTTNQKGGSK
ncbi:MAG: cytochrome C [Spirochaetota bacterium]